MEEQHTLSAEERSTNVHLGCKTSLQVKSIVNWALNSFGSALQRSFKSKLTVNSIRNSSH